MCKRRSREGGCARSGEAKEVGEGEAGADGNCYVSRGVCSQPRGSGGGGAGEAGDRIVNQILTEMDGVGARKNVICIGASNRPDMLDPAVCRPGRLDQVLLLSLSCPLSSPSPLSSSPLCSDTTSACLHPRSRSRLPHQDLPGVLEKVAPGPCGGHRGDGGGD
eukprot:746529-Hanusia_phi.AAC.3